MFLQKRSGLVWVEAQEWVRLDIIGWGLWCVGCGPLCVADKAMNNLPCFAPSFLSYLMAIILRYKRGPVEKKVFSRGVLVGNTREKDR